MSKVLTISLYTITLSQNRLLLALIKSTPKAYQCYKLQKCSSVALTDIMVVGMAKCSIDDRVRRFLPHVSCQYDMTNHSVYLTSSLHNEPFVFNIILSTSCSDLTTFIIFCYDNGTNYESLYNSKQIQ